ncbi:hypothetical protein BBK36DRAFT_1163794 [Trichoderma citrinoviride]|uniref:Uncharacterized protein n=1 Tax=Trichoderma citrinoviride TaxID=58853 RepID=A0A2T4AX20_9HYPO|nr:hypothetical protein BBK36DRAFT_1163794 [Trichoderma citrinoviride]PTB61624.1 hypothetical protein BBK36DRAFT_1163794 [Trichoderma citrinoviride]
MASQGCILLGGLLNGRMRIWEICLGYLEAHLGKWTGFGFCRFWVVVDAGAYQQLEALDLGGMPASI